MKITLDKNLNRKEIRKIVEDHRYLNFWTHEDLKGLCVCPYEDEDYNPDYQEMIYIVPTKWLKNIVKEEFGIKNLDLWLQEEYTSDESEIIFERALNERQIVMVDFN